MPTDGGALAITKRIDAGRPPSSRRAPARVTPPEARDRLTSPAVRRDPGARVLIMGPGGGDDLVRGALPRRASHHAGEINPIIAREIMSSEPYPSFAGDVNSRQGVSLVVDEAGSSISRLIRNGRPAPGDQWVDTGRRPADRRHSP